jgi:transposase
MYDPQLNALYAKMLEHHGVVARPCRPRAPDLKGRVESAVGYTRFQRYRSQRNLFPIRVDVAAGIGAGISLKQVVEAAVLLDDDNDVLNLAARTHGRGGDPKRWERHRRRGARGRQDECQSER